MAKPVQFGATGRWYVVSVITKRRGSTKCYLVDPDGKSVARVITSGIAVKLANAMNKK